MPESFTFFNILFRCEYYLGLNCFILVTALIDPLGLLQVFIYPELIDCFTDHEGGQHAVFEVAISF